MLYLLVTIVLQNGVTDILFDEYTTLKACNSARIEAKKHDNELTKVRAYCVKAEFKEK